MTPATPTTTRTGSSNTSLAVILAASFALKLLLVWMVSGMPCTHDQCEYLTLAEGIAAGQGLQTYDGYLWPPGYVYFLAWCSLLFGDTLTAPRILQVLISTATVPAVYLIGRRLADHRAGLVAAGIFAFYPDLVGFTHLIWPETVYLLPFTWGFWFLVRHERPRPADVAAAGFLMGTAALVRSMAFFFVLLAGAWLVWNALRHEPEKEARPRRLAMAALLVGCTLLPILPWTARNAATYGRFLLIDSTTGRNLYIGTNESPPSNWDLGFNNRRRVHDGRPRCDRDNPVETDRCEIRNALAFAATHPLLMVSRVPLKLADLLNPSSFFLRHARLGHYPYAFTVGQLRIITVILTLPYLVVAALAVAGLALWPGGTARRLVLLLLAYHLAVHALTFGMSRFRLPLVPFLAVAAAPLLTRSWRPLWAAAPRPRLILAGAVLAAVVALWAWRLPTVLDVFRPQGPLGTLGSPESPSPAPGLPD